MIKSKKLPANIEDLIPKAQDYLQSRRDILFAYFFGSFGRGKRLPLSDVDIAVYLKEPLDVRKEKMSILGTLIDILQTDEIDLVVLNNAPLPLRMRILENKKIVVDREPFLRHHYESLTMREYFDFSILEGQILNRRFLGGWPERAPQGPRCRRG
jgi:predicted nucleotidyltransferase